MKPYIPCLISCFCACDPRAVPWRIYPWGFSPPLRVFSPAVSTLSMNPWMTRLAQRDQIAPIVRATFTQRKLMMDFLGPHDNPTLETQFTERMLLHVLVADSFPRSSIPLLCPGITPILLIVAVHPALVFRTVSSFRQIRTTRISARLLRFSRHLSTYFPIEKAATDFSATASPFHFGRR